GKTHGQLSSCFIDSVDDNLQSIYDVNTDVAQLSKNGGGIGVYMGKVRGRGSAIKGFKGMSSGVVPWIRQLNNTAVSVDQLEIGRASCRERGGDSGVGSSTLLMEVRADVVEQITV